jgi:hypothetical protein
MKRIIGGKIYNTDTATRIAEFSNGCYGGDFHKVEETLYRTKKGAWFLEYCGGALSKYSRSLGNNSSTGSHGLQALASDEAYAWLEERERTAAIEAHFAAHISEA